MSASRKSRTEAPAGPRGGAWPLSLAPLPAAAAIAPLNLQHERHEGEGGRVGGRES